MLTPSFHTSDQYDPGLVSYVDMAVMLRPHLTITLPEDVTKIQGVAVKGKNVTALYLKNERNYTFACEANRVFPRQ